MKNQNTLPESDAQPKKVWSEPKIELMSRGDIQSGSISSYVENAPTPFGGTGSGGFS